MDSNRSLFRGKAVGSRLSSGVAVGLSSHSCKLCRYCLVAFFISTFVRAIQLALQRIDGCQPLNQMDETIEGTLSELQTTGAEPSDNAQSGSELAFTRSLLALSMVCPTNPYGALAALAGGGTHKATKLTAAETFAFSDSHDRKSGEGPFD
jgi:hypothetical protein